MSASSSAEPKVIASGVDDEPPAGNQRPLIGWEKQLFFWFGVVFVLFHLANFGFLGVETWRFRVIHIAGGLIIGFALMSAWSIDQKPTTGPLMRWQPLARAIASLAIAWPVFAVVFGLAASSIVGDEGAPEWLVGGWTVFEMRGLDPLIIPPPWLFDTSPIDGFGMSLFGATLMLATLVAIVSSWVFRGDARHVHWSDWILLLAAAVVCGYFIVGLGAGLNNRAGTGTAFVGNYWAALVGVLLILELTRRVAGLALVTISSVFIVYSFIGPYLPGFLQHDGYSPIRFFTYIYTDNGILGAPIAVSSTYIILFITFAAFLQASKVGDYFVNFAFAAAGWARGGPAKVAVFASGLMGMINGTSAGNVVATGSLTIPLMKRVGYRPKTAGAIEAVASTGGQIMPPIMGAGAFIMAEITGIPYTELIVAAAIPAVLYFVSVFVMVDLEAVRTGMRGMDRKDLPDLRQLSRQAYLFIPIVILIYALFQGRTPIYAGMEAMLAALIVSWVAAFTLGFGNAIKTVVLFVLEFTLVRPALRLAQRARGIDPSRSGNPVTADLPNTVMSLNGTIRALELAARMSVQMIAVCACAGIIVGVIALTGVGAKFANLLLGLAEHSQLVAMIFAMIIAMLLGMGMPTTAAYAVAASVVAPGLQQMGIPTLVAHFFVFYFAVISAITPPVALASYAGAAIAGANPLGTSVTSFKLGLAAYIVPFIMFYSPAMLLIGDWPEIVQVTVTALVGVYLMSSAVQGWFLGRLPPPLRAALLIGAICMIAGGYVTDAAGVGIAVVVGFWQYKMARKEPVLAE